MDRPSADPRSARSSRRRTWRALLVAGLALALVATGAVVLRGRELATGLITLALDRLGVPPHQLEVRAVGLGGVALGPVRLGGPDGPAASAIEVAWTPWGLLRGRLAHLEIAGLTASATIEQGRLAIAGLPPGGATGGGGSLPVERLDLAGAVLTLTLDRTRIVARLDASVMPAGDGGIVARGTVALSEQDVVLADIDLRVDTGDGISGRLSGELRDRSTPARLPPLAVTLQGRQDEGGVAASGRAATRDRGLVLALAGRHDLANGRGRIDIESEPILFKADGLQPADLLPAAGGAFSHVAGSVSARGRLSWGEALASRLAVTFGDVGFDAGMVRVGGLDGTVTLDSVLPLRTPGPQRLQATLQVAGLPPGPADLTFRLPGDGRLLLDAASVGLAGGTLRLGGVAIARGRPVDTALEVRAVDLGAVLTLLDVDGLAGSGTIGGRIPLRVEPSGVAIANGRLVASGPGVVRYAGAGLPDAAPGAASGADDSLRLLRQALADFHYTSLTLTLDRAASGDGSLLVNLAGANPAVLENHPFVLNIRLDANFDRLAALLFDGYAAAEDLLRRAARP